MKQYMFIGESYVHGLMDGDVVRRLKLGEVKMEDFSLIQPLVLLAVQGPQRPPSPSLGSPDRLEGFDLETQLG